MTQQALDLGAVDRDAGIERAMRGAGEAWCDQALAFFRLYAERCEEFTCEMARHWAEEQGLPAPKNNHAWGGIVVKAMKAGWLEMTGRSVLSQQRSCHKGPLRVWRSRLFRAAA